MPVRIFRTDDQHLEMAGQNPLGPIPHIFEAEPKATQSLLFVGGHPLLREYDTFEHVGMSHAKPQVGSSFVKPGDVTKQGSFTDACQALLFVNGKPVMTMAGSLETCSDAAKETSCDSAVLLAEVPPMSIGGSTVLPGNR